MNRTTDETGDKKRKTKEEIVEELGIADIDPTLNIKISEFLDKSELTCDEIVFYVYKFDNLNGGEGRSLVDKFYSSQIPDEDDIGRKHGSGRYMMIMTAPGRDGGKGFIRAYRFKVAPIYDTLVKPSAASMPVPQQSDPAELAFRMLERFMALMGPILVRDRDPDVGKFMMNTYAQVGQVMKEQALSNVETIGDFQRRLREMEANAEPATVINEQDGEEAPSIVEQFGPLIAEWIPKLLNMGPTEQAMIAAVKKTGMFKSLMANRRKVKALVAYLDNTQGVDNTNKILCALKMKR
jgi:hypothetical protein